METINVQRYETDGKYNPFEQRLLKLVRNQSLERLVDKKDDNETEPVRQRQIINANVKVTYEEIFKAKHDTMEYNALALAIRRELNLTERDVFVHFMPTSVIIYNITSGNYWYSSLIHHKAYQRLEKAAYDKEVKEEDRLLPFSVNMRFRRVDAEDKPFQHDALTSRWIKSKKIDIQFSNCEGYELDKVEGDTVIHIDLAKARTNLYSFTAVSKIKTETFKRVTNRPGGKVTAGPRKKQAPRPKRKPFMDKGKWDAL